MQRGILDVFYKDSETRFEFIAKSIWDRISHVLDYAPLKFGGTQNDRVVLEGFIALFEYGFFFNK